MTTTFAPTLLKDGLESLVVDAAESCKITWTPEDLDGAAILKVNLISLNVTLYDNATNSVVNSRNAQSVIDVNGGTVSTAGVLTLRLTPTDTAIVGTVAEGVKQTRCIEFIWTWNDGVAVQTGVEVRGFEIQQRATVV